MQRILTTLLLVALTATTATAEDCLDYSAYLGLESSSFLFGVIHEVEVGDGLVFYAHGGRWIRVGRPVGSPEGPEFVASLTDSLTDVEDLCYDGKLLFAGNTGGRVVTYSLVFPESAFFVGYIDVGGRVLAVEAQWPAVYVSSSGHGVQIYDYTNATAPVLVGSVPGVGIAYHLTIDDGVLSMLTGFGLERFELGDPFAPTRLGGAAISGGLRGLEVEGTSAYVAALSNGVLVFDLSDPSAPALTDSIPEVRYAYDVEVVGQRLFSADFEGFGDRYVWVSDRTDPHHPVLEGNFRTGGQARQLDHIDGQLFAVTGNLEVHVGLDRPLFDGSTEMQDWQVTENIRVVDDVAYLADYYEGLRILDVSDPGNPTQLSLLPSAGNPWDLRVAGNRAYVAARDAGVWIVDVSDPAAPVDLGSYDTPGSTREVVVQGTTAYVADHDGGFLILDVSDPAAPAFLGSLPALTNANQLELYGNLLYLDILYAGLHVIDVSDPTSPVVLHQENDVGYIADMQIVDGHLYVLTSVDVFQIYDLADPVHPALVSSVWAEAAEGLSVHRNVAYLASPTRGVYAIDVADPLAPANLGHLELTGRAEGIAAFGDHVFVASPSVTMSVVPVQCPDPTSVRPPAAASGVRLAGVHPNPFNPRVQVEFVTDVAGEITVEVFDLAGRRVRRLGTWALEAGLHRREWNGQDDRGRAVASGVYVVRVQGEGSHAAGKAVLVR